MKIAAFSVFILSIMASSCVSGPVVQEDQKRVTEVAANAVQTPLETAVVESGPAQGSRQEGTSPDSSLDAEIDALIAKAQESIEANRFAEGMQFYISALGRASKAGMKARTDELVGILNAAGTRLTIEPHESWIADDGSQGAGDVRSAARGEGLMPRVYLFESYGFGKSVVQDAMIRFEFVNNDGKLSATVRTDARGMANTTITAIASPSRDATIRAFPIFSSEGFTYALKTVFRDFSYLAPPNIALVMALERTPAGFNENPRVLDAVSSALKPLGVQTISYNGVMASDRFMAAFGGDSKELASFAGSVSPGYFALLLVEVGAPVQMQLQGKLYNIFTATGKATIRIVRADGTIVFAEAKDGIRGQGGSDQAAIDDCLVRIRSEMTSLLDDKAVAIQKAFLE
ncbi:MAG: hypothetical protein ABIJ86_04780 [Spirochaetota bacterium]